jgi:spore coat polysaccharide biosynthesis protein SpsF
MIGVIIQARMGATRLPGKVLKKLGDNALLDFQISRIKEAKNIDTIVVATTVEDADDEIEVFCNGKGIPCFRGSENDVLSRYYECARDNKFETIVRLTADCPLIDPAVIDKVVTLFFEEKVDYCSNTVPPETSFWPDGSDVEVFSFAALEQAHRNAVKLEDREHVTFFFWKDKSNGFKTAQLQNFENWSKYRFTVDYQKDYDVVKLIYDEITLRQVYGHIGEIVMVLDDRQDIRMINKDYYFGIGWEK